MIENVICYWSNSRVGIIVHFGPGANKLKINQITSESIIIYQKKYTQVEEGREQEIFC